MFQKRWNIETFYYLILLYDNLVISKINIIFAENYHTMMNKFVKRLLYPQIILFILGLFGCEKVDTADILMEGFYQESLLLPSYTKEEVKNLI